MVKTKIIATIGPASVGKIKKMCSEGMDIGRVNTKYADVEWFEKVLGLLKKAKCGVLVDINSKKYLEWLNSVDFDYLALSYCEGAKQIKDLRKEFDKKIKVVAKIETQKGIDNIDGIIKEANGVMVARGDLGKNISFEKVPLVQKLILKKAHKANKMDITATEMLLSMVDSKVPSRSEVSDVANAVFDGSDAVMLSEETAIGEYPVLVVKTMRKIVSEAEKGRKKLGLEGL